MDSSTDKNSTSSRCISSALLIALFSIVQNVITSEISANLPPCFIFSSPNLNCFSNKFTEFHRRYLYHSTISSKFPTNKKLMKSSKQNTHQKLEIQLKLKHKLEGRKKPVRKASQSTSRQTKPLKFNYFYYKKNTLKHLRFIYR